MPSTRTPAQIEASRRNGAKSKGPRTPEGRAASSKNALKHGLRADTHFVLENEDPERYQNLLDGYRRTFAPANEPEYQLVLEMARCAWRLERLAAVEAALFDLQARNNEARLAEVYPEGLTPDQHIARAFTTMCVQTNQLQVLLRYQTAARRGLLSTTATLARMQAERARRRPEPANLPNEPEPKAIPLETRAPLPRVGFPKPEPAAPAAHLPVRPSPSPDLLRMRAQQSRT